MLLHTRDIGQGIYQWQASFDPLVRRFEQARNKKLKKTHLTSLKQLVAKQITDNEKIILSGISPKYSIDNIDKGNFIIKEFQDDLAMNTARFKGYTPDARIVAHLRTRAKEFNVDVPIFLRKKQQDQRDPLGKRKFKKFQHYLVNEETNIEAQESSQFQEQQQDEYAQLYMSKGHSKGLGKGKGKGKKGHKGDKGGYRSQYPRPMLAIDSSKGKGKGKPSFQGNFVNPKGKGKSSSSQGNRGKGKISPSLTSELNTSSGISSHTSIVCGFCHKIGHTTENCRKRSALHNNTLYQQTRSKFSGRQQLLFAGLENSVFSPDSCSWCLQSHCDGSNCTPPEEPLFFTQTNNAFCEEILPLVKNAKLELPVDSNEPLSPQHFNFQDSYWGDDYSYPYAHQYTNEQSTYIYDINNDNDYNQYHYPQLYKGDEEYSSYNYEEGTQSSSQFNNEDDNIEHEGTQEGLLCEEDEIDTLYDDGLEQ
jgi:flagellar biosynthesis/type III secretory pathway protein FliH